MAIYHEQIAIGGASAGGGLTAALGLLTRDRGEIPLVFYLHLYVSPCCCHGADVAGHRPPESHFLHARVQARDANYGKAISFVPHGWASVRWHARSVGCAPIVPKLRSADRPQWNSRSRHR